MHLTPHPVWPYSPYCGVSPSLDHARSYYHLCVPSCTDYADVTINDTTMHSHIYPTPSPRVHCIIQYIQSCLPLTLCDHIPHNVVLALLWTHHLCVPLCTDYADVTMNGTIIHSHIYPTPYPVHSPVYPLPYVTIFPIPCCKPFSWPCSILRVHHHHLCVPSCTDYANVTINDTT